jgi:hypothetical protein
MIHAIMCMTATGDMPPTYSFNALNLNGVTLAN